MAEVSIRLFAGLRERAGWSRREIEAATVADVWPELELGDAPPAAATQDAPASRSSRLTSSSRRSSSSAPPTAASSPAHCSIKRLP